MTFWRTRARLPPSEVVPHPETVQMVPSAYLVKIKMKIKLKTKIKMKIKIKMKMKMTLIII